MKNWALRVMCLCIGTLCSLGIAQTTQETVSVIYKGKVVDSAGNPIAGATVRAYDSHSSTPILRGEFVTKADGVFSFQWDCKKRRYVFGRIVARKEGLALDWDSWYKPANTSVEMTDMTLTLSKPSIMEGTIVDQAGSPIAGATVHGIFEKGEWPELKWLTGYPYLDWATTTSNANGRFRFTNIPAGAQASFYVTSQGKAHEFDMGNDNSNHRSYYKAGQNDIKIKMADEAKITGKLVDKATGKGVGGLKILASMKNIRHGRYTEKSVSQDDGSFSIGGLQAGQYELALTRTDEETIDWVCTPVTVATKAGQTTKNVSLNLTKGGIVEITITDSETNKPLTGVSIGAFRITNQSRKYFSSSTDEKGIARIRLLPGEYQINNIDKQDYAGRQIQNSFTIKDGKTCKLAFKLNACPKIRGVVLDQVGNPVAGATIQALPFSQGDAKTNQDGKFELTIQQRSWSHNAQYVLMARHKNRNLAAAVDIYDKPKPIKVKLLPAVAFAGRVTGVDKKILPNAILKVRLNNNRWQASLSSDSQRTNADGCYEIKVMPSGRAYTITAQAKGYGKQALSKDLDEDETGRVEIEAFVLPLANMSVSGMVVDQDDKPVANAQLYIYGETQPNINAKTDKAGKFKIDNVIASRIHINAHLDTPNGTKRGSIFAKGGDKDIKLILGQNPRPELRRPEPKPKSLLDQPLRSLKAFGLKPRDKIATGKKMLICFWDMEQRPSRRAIKMLASRFEELTQQGIFVVAVQTSYVPPEQLQAWMKKHQIPFQTGCVPPGPRKSRRLLNKWAIHSQPWLILTNQQHLVKAEGVPIIELDEKIKQISTDNK